MKWVSMGLCLGDHYIISDVLKNQSQVSGPAKLRTCFKNIELPLGYPSSEALPGSTASLKDIYLCDISLHHTTTDHDTTKT